MNVRYWPRAHKDIDAIYEWIARDNARAAQRMEDAIRLTVQLISSQPKMGVSTGHANVRRHPMSKLHYAIFYRIDWPANTLDVLRVVHGKQIRDLKRIPKSL